MNNIIGTDFHGYLATFLDDRDRHALRLTCSRALAHNHSVAQDLRALLCEMGKESLLGRIALGDGLRLPPGLVVHSERIARVAVRHLAPGAPILLLDEAPAQPIASLSYQQMNRLDRAIEHRRDVNLCNLFERVCQTNQAAKTFYESLPATLCEQMKAKAIKEWISENKALFNQTTSLVLDTPLLMLSKEELKLECTLPLVVAGLNLSQDQFNLALDSQVKIGNNKVATALISKRGTRAVIWEHVFMAAAAGRNLNMIHMALNNLGREKFLEFAISMKIAIREGHMDVVQALTRAPQCSPATLEIFIRMAEKANQGEIVAFLKSLRRPQDECKED